MYPLKASSTNRGNGPVLSDYATELLMKVDKEIDELEEVLKKEDEAHLDRLQELNAIDFLRASVMERTCDGNETRRRLQEELGKAVIRRKDVLESGGTKPQAGTRDFPLEIEDQPSPPAQAGPQPGTLCPPIHIKLVTARRRFCAETVAKYPEVSPDFRTKKFNTEAEEDPGPSAKKIRTDAEPAPAPKSEFVERGYTNNTTRRGYPGMSNSHLMERDRAEKERLAGGDSGQ